MTYNVLMGTLNPTHSLTHSSALLFNQPVSQFIRSRKHPRTGQKVPWGIAIAQNT